MKKGFTLVELIVVIAVMIAAGIIAFVGLGSRKAESDLSFTTQEIATLLRQAQIDSMNQEGDVPWGVHFVNSTGTAPFYALFTTSYSTATVVGNQYRLPPDIAYTTSTLASGATLDVIFSPISGVTSATAIGFYTVKQVQVFSSTISVTSSGAVSY
jgi:prepilin-type N-terminal cleavage/methylation domain-containing protein